MISFAQLLHIPSAALIVFNFHYLSGDTDSASCIPNVSQYTDCTDDNLCSGCTKCECNDQRVWDCATVRKCTENFNRLATGEDPLFDDDMLENALQQMELDSKKKYFTKKMNSEHPLVPTPEEDEEKVQPLLETQKVHGSFEEDIFALMSRVKRSTKVADKNETIKFYNTVDEVNEDTLKNTNKSGTIEAKRIELLRKVPLTRRAGVLTNSNSSLNIKFNHPNVYNHHITDNKIETTHLEDHIDALSHEKLHTIIGNHSRDTKNKELSKLIVNELKRGTEIIGDEHAPVMSNITFKPDNDTLTAMAFIAGNLLNKLWNMEKDGDESLETEILKHEKIADLLDLFKEPLSMRQETFLKNALEQLSSAVNKGNVENISLCKSIQEASKVLKDSKNESKDGKLYKASKDCSLEKDKNNETEHSQNLSKEAISKIYNVFNLIKKYEDIKKQLDELKNDKASVFHGKWNSILNDKTTKSTLTQDENSTLNTFGNILEKLTKLILPSKTSKKFSNKIKTPSEHSVTKKMNKLFNIEVHRLKLSEKDKLLAKYLDHIEKNPGCVLNGDIEESDDTTLPKVEGDILYNLSEFFKIKSLVDLLKMVDPRPVFRTFADNTAKPVALLTQTEFRDDNNASKSDDRKFASAKEKLKAHLKTIVEDLIELQNASSSLGKGENIKVIDALPCIYNLLNSNKVTKVKTNVAPLDKVRKMFNSFKSEVNSAKTRRTDSNLGATGSPKSVVVWERVVKNLDRKQKLNTRRNLVTEVPFVQSFDSIKKAIDKMESTISNSYKKYAFMAEVPPSDKLVLLKTIQADTKSYIGIMEDLKSFMDQSTKLSSQKCYELDEFLDNAAGNIKLNARLIETLNKPKSDNTRFEVKNNRGIELKDNPKPSVREYSIPRDFYGSSNTISRDEILNRLIKNRIQLFIDTKEAGGDFVGDMNYDIAKKILVHMENGNVRLARELYKVFVSHKQDSGNIASEKLLSPVKFINEFKPMPITQKEPLIQFVNPKDQIDLLSQDHLLRQLLNIKNMKV